MLHGRVAGYQQMHNRDLAYATSECQLSRYQSGSERGEGPTDGGLQGLQLLRSNPHARCVASCDLDSARSRVAAASTTNCLLHRTGAALCWCAAIYAQVRTLVEGLAGGAPLAH